MKIYIFIGGKDKRDWSSYAVEHYIKLLRQFAEVQIETFQRDLLSSKNIDSLFNRVSDDCPIVVLDSRGKTLDTKQFANFIGNLTGKLGKIAFFIGGHEGFPEEIIVKSDNVVSLSELTFGHRLSLVIILEQLFRAFDLNTHDKYSR